MFWIKKRLFPKWLRPRSLSWKLTLVYAALFSLVLLALNAGILFGVRYFLIRQIRLQVQSSTQTELAHIGEREWDTSDAELPAELRAYPSTGVLLADASGRVLRTAGSLSGNLPAPTGQIGVVQVLETHGQHIVLENSRVAQDGQLLGYLQVVYNMQAEYRFLKLLFAVMAVADAVGILFSMAAGAFISRRALRPIDAIATAAGNISASDLTGRVRVGGADDELSRLARVFNEMIERLQRAFERQRRFVSDASHELRTPIAVIQGYADLIGRWGKNDPAVLDEATRAIESETEGMKGLVERLLLLARSDDGSLRLRPEPFDLRGVMREVAAETRLAFHRAVEVRACGPVMLTADRALVKQMLRALTDNAVKYTPADGSVAIEAEKSAEGVVLAVRDTGAGIPPADLPHVFDRFYRVEKARSRAQGGAGLGLSIVRSIVDAHRGQIRMESAPGRGTTVRIVLPERE